MRFYWKPLSLLHRCFRVKPEKSLRNNNYYSLHVCSDNTAVGRRATYLRISYESRAIYLKSAVARNQNMHIARIYIYFVNDYTSTVETLVLTDLINTI